MRSARLRYKLLSLIMIAVMLISSGCSIIPHSEEEHKLQIVTESATDRYDLAMAETGDVMLSKNIICLYSQLNEIKMFFEQSGYKVSSVYVHEGDPVSEGDLLATLDVSRQESEIINLEQQIAEQELIIDQNEEMIAFYDARMELPETGLRDKEQYTLSKQKCEEIIIECRSSIERAEEIIGRDRAIIEKSCLYSPVNGTIYFVKDDLQGWTSSKDTLVMKILDSGQCAFTATDRAAVKYMEIGTPVTVTVGNSAKYAATVTERDLEKGYMVFELDEPDYTISVGTRGNIVHVVDTKEQVLRLPRIAVYGTEDYRYVYTLSEEGVRELVPVHVGLIGDTHVEVLDGVELYDSVILR